MGAAQSTQGQDQVISAPEPSTSVQFSPSLVSRLSSPAPDADAGKKPASSTDEIVRRRLAAEAEHIRAQEAEILNKISAALEKENLDKEKPGMSSEVLGRDIEEVREKVERMKKERESKEGEGVRRARQGVVECYRDIGDGVENLLQVSALISRVKSDRPLDCWKEVEAFKDEVNKLERAFVKSLQ